MKIEVQVKSVYGKSLIYPANAAAEKLAALVGAKTLSLAQLQLARGLGHEVVEVPAYSLAAVA
jgi:hypothetical protein